MNHPSNPPPYDAAYSHGVQVHPVQIQPQPQVFVQVPQHQTHIVHGGAVRDMLPCVVVCRNCNFTVTTRTETKPAMRTHLCALCLCVVGLWPCCFIPYCIPSCNNVDHYCPQCNAYLGSYTE